MADLLSRILSASAPLTLAGVPAGFLPSLAADLARAAKGRSVLVAADEAAMRGIADAATFFAPELELILYPAWIACPTIALRRRCA